MATIGTLKYKTLPRPAKEQHEQGQANVSFTLANGKWQPNQRLVALWVTISCNTGNHFMRSDVTFQAFYFLVCSNLKC